jgi:hypothetical protein
MRIRISYSHFNVLDHLRDVVGMTALLIFVGIIVWMISMTIIIYIIRSAIDGSRSSKKLDTLIDEIRMLRREIRENKHIIDKKV